ncbi:uncharacterized protein B0H18DRAFT_1125092 [Fomitopsis serialis]|uniref:uncharacterized protein n=1 Tax=Fomitopsis serialis TaxID=139415 RepID=UPI002007B02B|nr:uncharacterized protein B0H18DRAFT_1125092 [Neoantrodia serialis]KAH9915072.1 hypothetical protein B0H18DRAFT_1125092 [Neoantrodia serialis]
MGALPIAEAQLVALFMQSVAYGVHLVTFAICIYTWFRRSSNSRTSASTIWLCVAIAFFVIGTCDVSFNLYHNLMAFVLPATASSGAKTVFDDAGNWVNVMRSVWFYMNAALSDAALIYRCWMVYANSRHRAIVGIVPLVLWLACIAFAVTILYYLSTVGADTTIPMIPQLQPFLYSFYVTTLVLNLLTTGLIIVRLWKIHRRTSADFAQTWRVRSPSRLSFADIILIMVESALLYTTTVVFCVVLDLARTNVYYGITDISLEVAGISFDMIIIRIWTGVSTEQTQAFAATLPTPSKLTMERMEQAASVHSGSTDLRVIDLAVSRVEVVKWQGSDENPV